MFIRNIYPCLRIVCVCVFVKMHCRHTECECSNLPEYSERRTVRVRVYVSVFPVYENAVLNQHQPTTELIIARLKLIQISIDTHNNIVYSEGNLHYIIGAIRCLVFIATARTISIIIRFENEIPSTFLPTIPGGCYMKSYVYGTIIFFLQ